MSGGPSSPARYDQTIYDDVSGDCLRASIATMMQWDPATLPNFVEADDSWWAVSLTGLERGWFLSHQSLDTVAERNQSPTGWCVATVPSIVFPGENHAVVVDAQTLELVHDPNPPKWKRESISRDDILGCLVAVRTPATDREDQS